jgi:hypothetical protein
LFEKCTTEVFEEWYTELVPLSKLEMWLGIISRYPDDLISSLEKLFSHQRKIKCLDRTIRCPIFRVKIYDRIRSLCEDISEGSWGELFLYTIEVLIWAREIESDIASRWVLELTRYCSRRRWCCTLILPRCLRWWWSESTCRECEEQKWKDESVHKNMIVVKNNDPLEYRYLERTTYLRPVSW